MKVACWPWPLDLEHWSETPKEREVKLSKAKVLNVATPRRSLGLGTFRGSRVSWAAFQPIISNGWRFIFVFAFFPIRVWSSWIGQTPSLPWSVRHWIKFIFLTVNGQHPRRSSNKIQHITHVGFVFCFVFSNKLFIFSLQPYFWGRHTLCDGNRNGRAW